MKIALCGPPRSGKSVLRERLKRSLREISPDPVHYPYIITTNPDGEGAWFQQTYHEAPETASQLRRTAKQSWTPEHAEMYAEWLKNSSVPITFADQGGIIDDYNRKICRHATHAIMLAANRSLMEPWLAFAAECNLTVIAELISAYAERVDRILSFGVPLQASVHYLERGVLDTPRPAVDIVAKRVLELLEER